MHRFHYKAAFWCICGIGCLCAGKIVFCRHTLITRYVYNIFFNHFHEAIIVFPILLLALELLITENRRGVFALAVALCAITNYFFFFGMVLDMGLEPI